MSICLFGLLVFAALGWLVVFRILPGVVDQDGE